MLKLFESVDKFTKTIAENMERKVNRSNFLKTIFSTVFFSFVAFSARPAFADGSSTWCENWEYETTCQYPNYTRCPGCSSSQTTKCPTGYKVTYAYWPQTGCWCVGYSWGAIACCDCTPNSNSNVTVPSTSDCGCGVTIR